MSGDHWPNSLHSVSEYALSLTVELRLSSVCDDQEDGDDYNDDADAGTYSAAYDRANVHVTVRLIWKHTQ